MDLRDLIFGTRSKPMDSKTYPVTRSEAEWRELLTPEQYHIMREHGTPRRRLLVPHQDRARSRTQNFS